MTTFVRIIIPQSTKRKSSNQSSYHKEARVGVDHLGLVAGLQVPEDGSIVQEGQVNHVLALFKLGGVDLEQIVSTYCAKRQFSYKSRSPTYPANFLLGVCELLMSNGDLELGGEISALCSD